MKYSNPQEAWYHEQKQKPQGEGCMLSVVSVAFLILTIALMLAFSGCTTTRYVPVEHHTTDTVYQSKLHRDSIYLHDSIRVSEKGDTIRIEHWRTKSISKEVHDTLYQAKHDTIPQPYPVEKLVPRERSKVEWGLIIVGIVALMGGIVWIALKLKRFLP
jgi:uncharacterized integral membrane protein